MTLTAAQPLQLIEHSVALSPIIPKPLTRDAKMESEDLGLKKDRLASNLGKGRNCFGLTSKRFRD